MTATRMAAAADAAGAVPAGTDTATALVNAYLTAFYSGDFCAARSLVADDFSFRGPFLQVDGAEEFFAGAQGLLPIVRGHRLLRQWADGSDVCTWYEVDFETPAGTGTIPMSEWHAVSGGKLVCGRVVFDAAAFRALMPPR